MNMRWTDLLVAVKTTLFGSFNHIPQREKPGRYGRPGRELVNVVHASATVSSPTLVFKKEQ